MMEMATWIHFEFLLEFLLQTGSPFDMMATSKEHKIPYRPKCKQL